MRGYAEYIKTTKQKQYGFTPARAPKVVPSAHWATEVVVGVNAASTEPTPPLVVYCASNVEPEFCACAAMLAAKAAGVW